MSSGLPFRKAETGPGVRLKGKLLTKGLCPRVAVETLETVAVVPARAARRKGEGTSFPVPHRPEPSSEFACAP